MSGAVQTSARIKDHNGWFEVPRNPLSKAGVFQYRGASISKDLPPDALFNVYRSPEELGKPEAINSFRLTPWIDGHVMLGDPEVFGPSYVPAEQKGVHGVIGENIYFDEGDGTLYRNVKVFSQTLADVIDAGKKQLSLGYKCQYVREPGISPDGKPYEYRQVNIRGNHNASVMLGKCGEEVAVMDGATDTWQLAFDEKEIVMVKSLKERNKKAFDATVKRIVGAYASRALVRAKLKDGAANIKLITYALDADEESASASEPGLSDVAEMLADVLPAIADINSSLADATAPDDDMEDVMDSEGKPVMDEATGKPKRQKKTAPAALPAAGMDAIEKAVKAAMAKFTPAVADAAAVNTAVQSAMDSIVTPLKAQVTQLEKMANPKTLMGVITERNKLADNLSHFVGAFDHSEMTTLEVAQYGIKKLEVPCEPGGEISAVKAYLHGRQPPRINSVAMDAKTEPKGSVKDYITGGAK